MIGRGESPLSLRSRVRDFRCCGMRGDVETEFGLGIFGILECGDLALSVRDFLVYLVYILSLRKVDL